MYTYLSIYLCICISMYLSIYLDSPTTLYFWGLSRKKHVFPKVLVLKLSTVSCMLVMVTHGGGLKLRKSRNAPHCQLETHCCRCYFGFGWLKAQEKRFPKHWFSFMFDATVSIFLALILGRALLFHFARMRVGLNTQLRTCGCIAQFWWQIFLGRFAQTMQTCKVCAKAFFSFKFQTYFFCAEGRPDGVRKYGKKRPKYGNIRPVWTRPNQRTFFLKTYLLFTVRPSICQNCVSSWHHKVRASGCAQSPCVFFRTVAMYKCLPPQLIVKSGQRFHISTEIEDPKLFCQEVSVIRVIRLGLRWCVRCLIQHQAGQAQSVHMIWFSNA